MHPTGLLGVNRQAEEGNGEAEIPGKQLTHHHEVFYEARKFIEEGRAKIFVIDHVDAHADLGLGDLCYKYLFFEHKIWSLF